MLEKKLHNVRMLATRKDHSIPLSDINYWPEFPEFNEDDNSTKTVDLKPTGRGLNTLA